MRAIPLVLVIIYVLSLPNGLSPVLILPAHQNTPKLFTEVRDCRVQFCER
jgi:hypothetical protein